MPLPTKTRSHVIEALSSTPRVLALLVAPFPSEHRVWDASLPERFTLRETVAHLADWDGVFQHRVETAILGADASVEDPDSGQVAQENEYATLEPHRSIRRFAVARGRLLERLGSLNEHEWASTAHHPRHGTMSVETQAVHILGHDGYHLSYLSLLIADARR